MLSYDHNVIEYLSKHMYNFESIESNALGRLVPKYFK